MNKKAKITVPHISKLQENKGEISKLF